MERLGVGKQCPHQETLQALKKTGAVYTHFTGGAGALAAKSIKKVENVYFLDELGIPEAAWILEVEDFGPLVVTMDAKGNSFYKKNLATKTLRHKENK